MGADFTVDPAAARFDAGTVVPVEASVGGDLRCTFVDVKGDLNSGVIAALKVRTALRAFQPHARTRRSGRNITATGLHRSSAENAESAQRSSSSSRRSSAFSASLR